MSGDTTQTAGRSIAESWLEEAERLNEECAQPPFAAKDGKVFRIEGRHLLTIGELPGREAALFALLRNHASELLAVHAERDALRAKNEAAKDIIDRQCREAVSLRDEIAELRRAK